MRDKKLVGEVWEVDGGCCDCEIDCGCFAHECPHDKCLKITPVETDVAKVLKEALENIAATLEPYLSGDEDCADFRAYTWASEALAQYNEMRGGQNEN